MGKASRRKKGPINEALGNQGRYEKELQPSQESPSKCMNITMNKSLKTKSFIASLVAVITFIVFSPALQNEFINWDDNEYVYDNPFIRSLDARLLKSAFGGFYAANWHPLTWISHAIDYAIWGLNPLGHHLTNNILHALNTMMVVFLVMQLMEVLRKTEGNNRLSWSFLNDRTIGITGAITGLLFGLHPLHVESVAWVAERKDLLCALFFVLSVTVYAGDVQRESAQETVVSRLFNARYFLAMGFFVLALMSKPMAVTLPAVLLIVDWYPFGRIQSLKTLVLACVEKLPFIALSVISSVVTILAQKAGGTMALTELVPLSTRVIVAAKALITYLWKIIVPLNLVPYYPYPENVSLLSLEYFFPMVLVIGITIFCIVFSKKQKLWLSGWGYYVIMLLPVIGIVQVGSQSMADRYTYLPSLGPFLIIGVIAAKVYAKVTALNQRGVILRIASLLIALAMLILISYATVGQIGIWKNSTVFWSYLIEKEPERAPMAHNNLGTVYASQGQFDRAIPEYQAALRLKPDFAEAHNNFGDAYSSQGQLDKAIPEYQAALRLKPDFAQAHYNLGLAYASQGQFDRAIPEYQAALRLKPDFAEAHNNLGDAYSSQGQLDRAIVEYQTALRLNPHLVNAHYNLALAYRSQGQLDRAIAEFQTALRLQPNDAEAHYNLGVAYSFQGQLDRAIVEYQTTLRLKPDDEVTHYNLGGAYASQGQLDRAIAEYQTALRLKPDFNEARQRLNDIVSRRH
jgi:protein O-mannosyl-transferase